MYISGKISLGIVMRVGEESKYLGVKVTYQN
jgi:hypothetical protein